MIRERARPSAPRSSAARTAIAHRAICQPRKNHGDPRKAVTPALFAWSVKNANGENSRTAVNAAEPGCDQRQERRQVQPAVQDQEQHERGAGEADPAAQRDAQQRAAERRNDDLPGEDGDPR